MAEKSISSAAPILARIETGSRRVNQLATELSQRILAFEEWLNQLPGRVKTTLWTSAPPPNDDDPEKVFGLRLDRDAKRWVLWCAFAYTYEEERVIEWARLNEASVETKSFALSHFAKLLAKIAETQESLALNLEASGREFDALAEAIGLKQKAEQTTKSKADGLDPIAALFPLEVNKKLTKEGK